MWPHLQRSAYPVRTTGNDGRSVGVFPRNISLRPQCRYRSLLRPRSSHTQDRRGLHQATDCSGTCASIMRVLAERLGAPHASACPSAATASATISSNPDGSVASAAASSVQLSLARPRSKRGERHCTLRAGARRSCASITATSTSSRCTPTHLGVNSGICCGLARVHHGVCACARVCVCACGKPRSRMSTAPLWVL